MGNDEKSSLRVHACMGQGCRLDVQEWKLKALLFGGNVWRDDDYDSGELQGLSKDQLGREVQHMVPNQSDFCELGQFVGWEESEFEVG